MTPDEITAFVQQQRTVIIARLGPTGVPHLVAMWYVVTRFVVSPSRAGHI